MDLAIVSVTEGHLLKADLPIHMVEADAPGRSAMSTGRSSTSKTRSKLTIAVTNSTRALASAESGRYS